MTAKSTAQLMADLGVTKTHSRPHTSNDNPFSESAFKTLKYQPEFPKTFGCKENASTFCRAYFRWYNEEHHHSALGLMTPNQIHYAHADAITTARQTVLDAAFAVHPERFPVQAANAAGKAGCRLDQSSCKVKDRAKRSDKQRIRTKQMLPFDQQTLVTPRKSSPDSTGGTRSGRPSARPSTLADGRSGRCLWCPGGAPSPSAPALNTQPNPPPPSCRLPATD